MVLYGSRGHSEWMEKVKELGGEYAWEMTRFTALPNENKVTSEREPQKRMPWDMDDFELAVSGIETAIGLIEVTTQSMKLHLGLLQQIVEDQEGAQQSG